MIIHIALLAVSLVIIVIIDVPRLIRQGLWRELWAYLAVLATGYTIAFLAVFGVIQK